MSESHRHFTVRTPKAACRSEMELLLSNSFDYCSLLQQQWPEHVQLADLRSVLVVCPGTSPPSVCAEILSKDLVQARSAIEPMIVTVACQVRDGQSLLWFIIVMVLESGISIWLVTVSTFRHVPPSICSNFWHKTFANRVRHGQSE
jgi:hypothetical protein